MGTFKVKPSAVTFTCNGIASFSDYLTLVGISTDSEGFVDLSKLCTQYAASETTKTNMKAQLNTKFYYDSDTSKNLYNTWLYSQYPGTVPGRITVPFQDSGTSQTIVLPGTTPHFKTKLVEPVSNQTNGAKILETNKKIPVAYATTRQRSIALKKSLLANLGGLISWLFIPLGFGKASNGTLKNHYPKGLRTKY